MLRLLPGAVLVCLHLSVSSISAQNRDEFVRPFQEEILRVPALDTQSRFDPGLPYFGKGRAFIASGYLKDGVVAFNLQPNSRDYLRIEKGLARVSYPANKWLTQRLLESVRRYSGPVAIGDVIPLFGALYRITDFRQEDNGGKGTEIILQRVEAGDWPDGITLDPFAYPVLTGGGLNVSNLTPIDIHSVTFDEKANQFRLTVVHQYIKPWREFRAREVAWREGNRSRDLRSDRGRWDGV